MTGEIMELNEAIKIYEKGKAYDEYASETLILRELGLEYGFIKKMSIGDVENKGAKSSLIKCELYIRKWSFFKSSFIVELKGALYEISAYELLPSFYLLKLVELKGEFEIIRVF